MQTSQVVVHNPMKRLLLKCINGCAVLLMLGHKKRLILLCIHLKKIKISVSMSNFQMINCLWLWNVFHVIQHWNCIQTLINPAVIFCWIGHVMLQIVKKLPSEQGIQCKSQNFAQVFWMKSIDTNVSKTHLDVRNLANPNK